MVCHQAALQSSPPIKRLTALAKDAKPFPSKPERGLADFVFFSHARHSAAGIECATCHGPVMEQDAAPSEAPRTMKACVDCHRKNKAAVACNACHELNQ
jgi:hypothetical protein